MPNPKWKVNHVTCFKQHVRRPELRLLQVCDRHSFKFRSAKDEKTPGSITRLG